MCVRNEPQTGSKPPPEVVLVDPIQSGSTVSVDKVEPVRFGSDGTVHTGLMPLRCLV